MSEPSDKEAEATNPLFEESALFSGGCACQAIRYECSAQSVLSFNCHCLDCQRASGSAYASVLIVPAPDFRLLRGEPKYYTVNTDSGYTLRRGFCPECGSPVLAEEPHRPLIVLIQAGSLDDPSWHKPAADFYTKRAQPWDYMNPEVHKFTELPPAPDMPLFRIQQG